jgi:hypothetical protein
MVAINKQQSYLMFIMFFCLFLYGCVSNAPNTGNKQVIKKELNFDVKCYPCMEKNASIQLDIHDEFKIANVEIKALEDTFNIEYVCDKSPCNIDISSIKEKGLYSITINTENKKGTTTFEVNENTYLKDLDKELPSIKEPLNNFNGFFIDSIDNIGSFTYYNCDNIKDNIKSEYEQCLINNIPSYCARMCSREIIKPENGYVFYSVNYGFILTKEQASKYGIECEENSKCFVSTLSKIPFDIAQTFFDLIAGKQVFYTYYVQDEWEQLYSPDYRVKNGYVFDENESLKPFVFSIPSYRKPKYFLIFEQRREFGGLSKTKNLIAKIKIYND